MRKDAGVDVKKIGGGSFGRVYIEIGPRSSSDFAYKLARIDKLRNEERREGLREPLALSWLKTDFPTDFNTKLLPYAADKEPEVRYYPFTNAGRNHTTEKYFSEFVLMKTPQIGPVTLKGTKFREVCKKARSAGSVAQICIGVVKDIKSALRHLENRLGCAHFDLGTNILMQNTTPRIIDVGKLQRMGVKGVTDSYGNEDYAPLSRLRTKQDDRRAIKIDRQTDLTAVALTIFELVTGSSFCYTFLRFKTAVQNYPRHEKALRAVAQKLLQKSAAAATIKFPRAKDGNPKPSALTHGADDEEREQWAEEIVQYFVNFVREPDVKDLLKVLASMLLADAEDASELSENLGQHEGGQQLQPPAFLDFFAMNDHELLSEVKKLAVGQTSGPHNPAGESDRREDEEGACQSMNNEESLS
mmetsp:Transcript_12737/g.30972  ORF Transcript_12737/g.30972 Transcript_12737/m.30972 type:complete len:415 (+) Transcript_12737:479-1723(+)